MYPVLFRLGEFQVTSFGVLVAISALAGLWILNRELTRSGLPSDALDAAIGLWPAQQLGPASRVVPIDKLSLPLTVLLAALLLEETVSWKVWVSALLMTAGAPLTIA